MAAPSILVGTPCFGGLMTVGFTSSLLGLYGYAAERGWGMGVKFVPGDALITRARSTIVAAFLDNPDATHLLFVDADISFAPEQVKRLLKFDADVAAAIYPVKSLDWQSMPARMGQGEPIRQAGLVYVAEHCVGDALKSRDGFCTAEYAGTGFLLIKRAVFARMIAAYPETKFTKVHNFGAGDAASNLYALFDCIIDPKTGHYLSEDYSFCRRWRALGGEIWIDLESKLTHTGPYAFEGDAARRYASLRAETKG